MPTHVVYGMCPKCYFIIKVTKSTHDKNKNTIYECPKCKSNTVFDFSKSKEIERRIDEKNK